MFSDKQMFKKAFVKKLMAMHGRSLDEATSLDLYKTLGTLVREEIMGDWTATKRQYLKQDSKQAYYFSLEYLLGRLLESNLFNIGALDRCRAGLSELGINLDDITGEEPDAGLGNGGLGRLAACFLDSLASLNLPGHGFGIRYKYGLFEQRIRDNRQVELPERWLREGNVWEIRRPEEAVEVRFGGNVRAGNVNGRLTFHHEDFEVVRAVPYDTPVIGYRNNVVNTLKLWNAELVHADRCDSMGCYRRLVEYKRSLESMTELLYPDDSDYEGKALRLKQQYFLVSAGLQNIVQNYKKRYSSLMTFHEKVAVHVNDTHPVLAIPELMRIFMDEEGMSWDQAWEITTKTVSYTNHTILAEALEKWPEKLVRSLLPRMYMIIEEINNRLCGKIWNNFSLSPEKQKNLAIVADGQVRMAHLAIEGSHSVNGVAKMHTEILKQREMKDFYSLYPEKFNNKTNGITHRRWMLHANPGLTNLVTGTIGPEWVKSPQALSSLSAYAGDPAFQERLFRVKRRNKEALARIIEEKNGLAVDVDSIFDVQVKRLHPYKRQLLNVLHIMHLYNCLRQNPGLEITPRTFIFGAKAFPNYHLAKNIVMLINSVARVVNRDKRISEKLKVVFMENYRVSLAEQIIPAADLSEQISTAGKEASGTGNMKFMLNGAVTMGTQDGANIEITEAVGMENIFIFGLTAEEILHYYMYGGYHSYDLYREDPRIRTVVNQLINGHFGSKHDFRMIYEHLLNFNDEFFVLKDFDAYAAAQEAAGSAYNNRKRWLEMCTHNIARAGAFSSDLTIQKYASEIWGIKPVKIPASGQERVQAII